jgi:hypothetical protein
MVKAGEMEKVATSSNDMLVYDINSWDICIWRI